MRSVHHLAFHAVQHIPNRAGVPLPAPRRLDFTRVQFVCNLAQCGRTFCPNVLDGLHDIARVLVGFGLQSFDRCIIADAVQGPSAVGIAETVWMLATPRGIVLRCCHRILCALGNQLAFMLRNGREQMDCKFGRIGKIAANKLGPAFLQIRDERDVATETVELRDNQRCAGHLCTMERFLELGAVIIFAALNLNKFGYQLPLAAVEIFANCFALRFKPRVRFVPAWWSKRANNSRIFRLPWDHSLP